MHTYRKSGKDKDAMYTVGFERWDDESTAATWRPIRDFGSEFAAACFVSFLNGGEYSPHFMEDFKFK